jgi:hypothetical protein
MASIRSAGLIGRGDAAPSEAMQYDFQSSGE